MPISRPTTCLMLALLLPGVAFSDSIADLGARIAQKGTPKGVAPCVSCHGPEGAGMAATAYPRIAGLDAGYLAKQLRDIRSGRRKNPIMASVAANLTEREIAAVSAYYAALPVPPPPAKPPAGKAAKSAADLVQWGDWTGRGLPACRQCHAPGGNGIGSAFPGIAAQQASYIKAQLQAWQAGTRSNDPLGLMKAVADKLTAAEVDAVAAYYAAQPGGAPTPAERMPKGAAEALTMKVPLYTGDAAQQGTPPVGRAPGSRGYFKSPPRDAIPGGPFGEVVRRGQTIFENTNANAVSAKYVGNDQACGNCHIDAGRLAGSAPLWAAWVAYPAYRSKDKKVNTFIQRVEGCFKYSMNAQASAAGGPPAADSDTIVALVAYSFWLAKGAATGDDAMPGRGYPPLTETRLGFDPKRGAAVYAARCALCHGEKGNGATNAEGRTLFPPLWGPGSYNWGAGMHRVDAAAAFVKHNMPLGLEGAVTDQEAWDVAAFMNSHERPQDPRFKGDLAATTKRFHASRFDYYGKRRSADGLLLGERPARR
jgi:thiosulfate dehydrogenase